MVAYIILGGFGILLIDALFRDPWITLLGILLPLGGVWGLVQHTVDWCMRSPACPVG